MSLTLKAFPLAVASAYPDPPFELADGSENGFDIDLMRALCACLGLQLQRQRYLADNFDGIFDRLARGTCDAVISGATITPERSAIVQFSEPYLEFNQGIAVNHQRTPGVSTEADLHGLAAGIQSGNTSDSVARRWVSEGVMPASGTIPTMGSRPLSTTSRRGRSGW
jgi:polar amino acid transport system substrate-binding protein